VGRSAVLAWIAVDTLSKGSFFPKKTLVKNFTMMQFRALFSRAAGCGTGGFGVLTRAFKLNATD
jgi:hypothetical protein